MVLCKCAEVFIRKAAENQNNTGAIWNKRFTSREGRDIVVLPDDRRGHERIYHHHFTVHVKGI